MRGRVSGVVVGSLFFGAIIAAQAPAAKPPAPAARPAAAKPLGNLAQVMRAILFPNSNIIFFTQTDNPADPKKPLDVTFGTFANVYTGWQVVENAAIALNESADLILKPGRVCSNGLPAPVGRADYRKFAQGLRDAGTAALKAAQTKDMDKMVEAAGTVSEACENCHTVYREKPDLKDRCKP